jgi:hypothetical protein
MARTQLRIAQESVDQRVKKALCLARPGPSGDKIVLAAQALVYGGFLVAVQTALVERGGPRFAHAAPLGVQSAVGDKLGEGAPLLEIGQRLKECFRDEAILLPR